MENLLVSFSGGETSAFMAQWLWNNKQDEYNMVFVFANTGQENEETLEFVEQCSAHFGFRVHWVECKVIHGERKSSTYKQVNYETASRNGEPFEDMVIKYGIPNQAFPHCTRELKQNPITAFAKDYFNGEPFLTAIGIRQDEADRINDKAKERGFIYPLINRKMIPVTKPMVNFYWKMMPFRLKLKGYQGNCITCWKKSDKKLFQIAKENPKAFDFMDRMEEKYKKFVIANGNIIGYKKYEEEYEEWEEPIYEKVEKQVTFFRKNRSAKDIIKEAKNWNRKVKDDSVNYSFQTELDLIGGESCEVFSECNGE